MLYALVGLVFIAWLWMALDKQQKLIKARKRYQQALAELSEDPNDNVRRTTALNAGRHFAEVARKHTGQKGRAIFDEVALQNDLAARPPRQIEATATTTDRAEQLTKLASLHEKGLLTREEFEREKGKLLS